MTYAERFMPIPCDVVDFSAHFMVIYEIPIKKSRFERANFWGWRLVLICSCNPLGSRDTTSAHLDNDLMVRLTTIIASPHSAWQLRVPSSHPNSKRSSARSCQRFSYLISSLSTAHYCHLHNNRLVSSRREKVQLASQNSRHSCFVGAVCRMKLLFSRATKRRNKLKANQLHLQSETAKSDDRKYFSTKITARRVGM